MSEEVEASSGKESLVAENAGKKVLVIDDTADVRFIVVETLLALGFETLGAEDGVSGIQLATTELPDLIICDIQMPNMDGYETLTAIRQNPVTAMIPFIFLSGAADKLNMRKGMELGADDYLTKPFTHKELLAAVNARLVKKAEVDRQADKKLKELRGNLSTALPHELRTPLNGIMGLAAILMEDYATLPPEEVLDYARYIHESALRLHRLIENFLVFSQMELMASESKTIAMARDLPPLDIVEVITKLGGVVSARFERPADLQLHVTQTPVFIPHENFRKIVEELIDNAFKFSTPGTPVTVEAGLVQSAFTLKVTDRGRGMTVDQISRIAPHLQFDRDVYEQQGSGLGLTIARRMTELLGGRLVVESVQGEGTTVTVTFENPAVAKAA